MANMTVFTVYKIFGRPDGRQSRYYPLGYRLNNTAAIVERLVFVRPHGVSASTNCPGASLEID